MTIIILLKQNEVSILIYRVDNGDSALAPRTVADEAPRKQSYKQCWTHLDYAHVHHSSEYE